jgi:hypothetical protein
MIFIINSILIISVVALSGCQSSDAQRRTLLSRLPSGERANFRATATAVGRPAPGPGAPKETPGISGILPGVWSVYVLPFDFFPVEASPDSSQVGTQGYDINWPGTDETRHDLNWSDVRFYHPAIELRDPAPADVALSFFVCQDRTWWPDKDLAVFNVIIRQGSKIPMDSDIVCQTSLGLRTPTGAPSESTGAFWLGTTKKGYIRGNVGVNGETADVYLELWPNKDTEHRPSGYEELPYEYEHAQSPRHTVSRH